MPRKFNIPKFFTLANHRWEVRYGEDLPEDCDGECRHNKTEIVIRPGLSRQMEEHTFLHEFVHAVCFTLGWEKLNSDEGKVDALAGMFHQFLQTKRLSL